MATPSRLDFVPQAIGTASPAQSIVLDAFAAGQAIVSIEVPAGFEATHDCIPRVGSTCTIQVRFRPTNQETLEATLTITGSPTAPGSVRTVTLAGAGERSLVSHYYRSILRRAPDAGGKSYWEGESTRVQRAGGNPEETLFAMAAAFFSSPEYLALGRDDGGFVEDLYQAFFLRAPDAGGTAYWSGQLAQGMPRQVVLTAFLLSTEFGAVARRLFGSSAVRKEVDTVMDFYRGMLARIPDDGGLAHWVTQFRSAQCASAGAVAAKADEISAAFLDSAEYAARARTNSQYVGDLYNAFLRRGGDLGGVQFWIQQLGTGAQSREGLRKAFLASPEFTARVAQVLAEGCYGASSQTLLEGSHRYSGSFPPAAAIMYLNHDGVWVTHPRAYPGFVLLQSPNSSEAAVAALVSPLGGTIVPAVPLAGQFMVKVPGSSAFIAAVKDLSWVEGAWPVQPLQMGTQLLALDSTGSIFESACSRNHGPYVVDIMSRRSATPGSYVDVDGRDGLEISWELGYRMYEAQKKGERLIVNISMQSASSGPRCLTLDACLAAKQGQLEFLRTIVKMMQINANVQPERADNTLVTVIAGNAGAQLDLELKLLKLHYPKGFERVVVVGGTTPTHVMDTGVNHLADTASRDMVYARSDEVQVGGTTCDGTSFAAPEVASVLDYVWSRRPELGSAEILKALREALAANNTALVPQDANGRTMQAFLDQVVARLPLPPCTYVYSAFGACQPNGTQTRTVISSSPAQCQGTPVLQQPCTYVPPPQPCTYVYSAWSSCVNGQETRTVLSASPPGCTGSPVVTRPCSANACCACTFDVFCTVFGQGGCWRCSQGTIVNQSCTANGALVSPGACTCDASLYQTC